MMLVCAQVLSLSYFWQPVSHEACLFVNPSIQSWPVDFWLSSGDSSGEVGSASASLGYYSLTFRIRSGTIFQIDCPFASEIDSCF